VVARLVIEIRSDGSRTIARGAMEDVASGQSVALEARGDSPLSLALSLAAGAGWASDPLPSAFYESVKPFLDLPSPLQRVLAADAALAFSASDVWQRGTRDNTVEVANVVRSMLRSAADVAFGVPVGPVAPRLLAVSGDVGGAPVLFLRGRRAPVELAGRLPVAWIALAVLGLAVVGDALVVELFVDGDVVRGRGFRLVGRDADLTSCDVTLSRRDAERRVALAVFS
jgi:hypothetical protein